MLFLLSGEGPTDLGECEMGHDPCEGAAFQHGPLAVVVASLAEPVVGYDPLEAGHFRLVAKATLKAVADELEPRKVRVPGRTRPRETRYFYTSARALAVIARRWAEEAKDDVVAVLFRDSDTSRSEGQREWQLKWDSMNDGFDVERHQLAVAVLPRPTSEAWFLCLLSPRYFSASCNDLEERSSSGHAAAPLKTELAELLGGLCTREILCDRVRSIVARLPAVTMPSFIAFRDRLETVVRRCLSS